MNRKEIAKDLSEKHIETLRCPEKIKMSNGWASLHIRIDSMSKEQRELIWKAMDLLSKAGIGFDSGCGCGNIDWELDWSLNGAYITVKPIRCMNCEKTFPFQDNSNILWVRIRRKSDNYFMTYSYCSEECAKKDTENDDLEILSTWKEEGNVCD